MKEQKSWFMLMIVEGTSLFEMRLAFFTFITFHAEILVSRPLKSVSNTQFCGSNFCLITHDDKIFVNIPKLFCLIAFLADVISCNFGFPILKFPEF